MSLSDAFKRKLHQAANTAKGGARFASAFARDDFTDRDEFDRRRAICEGCPSMQMHGGGPWCGEPLIEADDPPTCGCALALKCWVASEQCPQGKWGQFSLNQPPSQSQSN